MGQIEAYTTQDMYMVSVVSGVLSTYIAEEIEIGIESVVPYFYSANLLSKKRRKLTVAAVYSGDLIGAMQTTFNYFNIKKSSFIAIDKSIDEKTMWQDPFLTKWEGAASRESLDKLEEKHNWVENA